MNNHSSIHQVECTCHGGNPNCFKCGGWGYIDSVSANRLIDGPAGAAGKNGSVASPRSSKSRKKRKLTAVKPRLKKPPIDKSSASKFDGSVLCRCGSRVAKSYYSQHLVLSCKANKKAARKILKGSSGKTRQRVKFEGTAHSRNMDATKNYAHAFRERGAFGSHPSHDGFDDESSP